MPFSEKTVFLKILGLAQENSLIEKIKSLIIYQSIAFFLLFKMMFRLSRGSDE
jgi:hypothetical protein